MNIFKSFFCIHFWVKLHFQKSRQGMFDNIKWEWVCKKCGKIKWSDYENAPPEPNYLDCYNLREKIAKSGQK